MRKILTKGGNRRCHKATHGGKFSDAIATNCGKLIAAGCHYLLPGYGPRFFLTNSLGDGVIKTLRLSHSRKPRQITFD
jgi:hypothetical protein